MKIIKPRFDAKFTYRKRIERCEGEQLFHTICNTLYDKFNELDGSEMKYNKDETSTIFEYPVKFLKFQFKDGRLYIKLDTTYNVDNEYVYKFIVHSNSLDVLYGGVDIIQDLMSEL